MQWLLQNDEANYYTYLVYEKLRLTLIPTGSNMNMSGACQAALLPSPLYGRKADGSRLLDSYSLSTVPAVQIPYSANSNIVFEQPFVYKDTQINLNDIDYECLPFFNVTCFQTLQANGVAGSARFRVYVELVGVKVALRRPYLAPAAPSVPIVSASTYTIYIGAALGKESQVKSSTGVVSHIAEAVSQFSGKISTIEPTGIAKIVSNVAGAVSTIAGAFGFDKPTSENFAVYQQPRIGDHLISTNGLDSSVVANVDPTIHDTTDIVKLYGSEVNWGSLKARASMYSLLFKYSLPSTIAANPVVRANIPIIPGLALSVSGGSTLFYNNLAQTCIPFTLWRGSLKYRISFYADHFTAGELLVGISNIPFAVGTNFDTANTPFSQYTIAGTTIIEFSVPWNQLQYWQVTTQKWNPAGNRGTMYLSLISTAPFLRNGVAINADFSVEVCAGDDFEWAEPGNNACCPVGLFDSHSTPDKIDSAIVPIHSWLELYKRYAAARAVLSVVNTITLPPSYWNFGPLAQLFRTYMAFRGSLRATIYVESTKTAVVIPINPRSPSSGTMVTNGNYVSGAIYRDGSLNPEIAMEMHCLPLGNFATLSTIGDSYQSLQLNISPTASPSYLVWLALGDDFTFCYPIPLGHQALTPV